MDRVGSGSCPVAGFDVGVGLAGSAIRELVN